MYITDRMSLDGYLKRVNDNFKKGKVLTLPSRTTSFVNS